MRYLPRPWLSAAICAALLLPAGVALPQRAREFADSGHEVASYFEGGQLELKDWKDGPVEYIMLPYERDEWRELDNDEHRRQFIAWFWGRRDLDARDDQHEFRTGFYQRVAYANQRFRGFPRGWRSAIYAEQMDVLNSLGVSDRAIEAIMGQNARHVFGLDRAIPSFTR